MSPYDPKPIATDDISVPDALAELTEKLAENVHDQWALQRIKTGWRYGKKRDDDAKTHPCLVSYADLAESEKDYDRCTAVETLKAIIALGFLIHKDEQ